jgi:hypothetical protein
MFKPLVLYGRETWAVTEQTNSALKIWEWKILRKIYGPMKDQIFRESELMMTCRLCIENQLL